MAWTLTIQAASASDGKLRLQYAKNGDSGGHGIEWPQASAGDYEIREEDLEDFILRLILTVARRRGLTPAQLVGKTITVDGGAQRNLIFYV